MGVGKSKVDKLNAWFGKTQAARYCNMTVAAKPHPRRDRPVRLREVYFRALPEPHARDHSRSPGKPARCASAKWMSTTGPRWCRFAAAFGRLLFQKGKPFPTMSIYDNVAAGLQWLSRSQAPGRNRRRFGAFAGPLRIMGRGQGHDEEEVGRQPLRRPAATAPASPAPSPSSPRCCRWTSPARPSTRFYRQDEELIFQLKERFTIVIVTHNMQQASRVRNLPGFFSSAN